MKVEDLNDISVKVLACRSSIVVSISSWCFHKNWEPDIFKGLDKGHIKQYKIDGDMSVDFFSLAYVKDENQIERLIRYPAVRLIANELTNMFWSSLSGDFLHRLASADEIDVGLLKFLEECSSYDWLAIRNGDEGDAYFHVYENVLSRRT